MIERTNLPPFDIQEIRNAWASLDTSDNSPALLYRRAVRSARTIRLTRKRSWPLDAAHPSANLCDTARYTGKIRRLWLDRGPGGWIKKSERAVDLWREGCQKQSRTPILLNDQIDPHSVSWIVLLAELIGDRYERKGKTMWARELYLDFLRSAQHLRWMAPLDQARFTCAMEMRMLSELRRWAFSPQTNPEDIRLAINELDAILKPIDPRQHFESEYARLLNEQYDDQLTEGTRIGLLWFWELTEHPVAARTKMLREQHQADGTSVMKPHLTHDFCERHGLASVDIATEQLKTATVQTQLGRFADAINYLDQCLTARAAARASLIVAAYQREKGNYPQELSTACELIGAEPPTDPYSLRGANINYLRSPGQRLRGHGVDWSQTDMRTQLGQPIIYSVGADGDDDRCTTVWNRRLSGRGDWAFPLQPQRTPRRWVQFDARMLLIVFTIVGVLLGIRMSPPGRHKAALNAIERVGGGFDFVESSKRPSFAERWLGERYGRAVASVTLNDVEDLEYVSHLLPYLDQVTALDLSNSIIRPDDFEYIGRMEKLTNLSLSGAKFPSGSVARLENLNQLTAIDLGDSNADDADLQALVNCKSLADINMCNAKVTGNGFAKLAHLPIARLVLIGSPINDVGLAGIGQLKQLEHLDLDSTPIRGPGLVHLQKLTRLETLDARATQIDDTGLKNLPALPALNSLYLQSTRLTGEGLSRIPSLPKLETLSIGATKITDASLQHLTGCKALASLSLEDNKITGKGLQVLAGIKTLTTLDISGNPVDKEAVRKLKLALPDLELEE